MAVNSYEYGRGNVIKSTGFGVGQTWKQTPAPPWLALLLAKGLELSGFVCSPEMGEGNYTSQSWWEYTYDEVGGYCSLASITQKALKMLPLFFFHS